MVKFSPFCYIRRNTVTFSPFLLNQEKYSKIISFLCEIGQKTVHEVDKLITSKYWLFAGPFTVPVDEEVESQHLKFISSPPEGMTFHTAVMRFNSNISYSGLLHAVTQTEVSITRENSTSLFALMSSSFRYRTFFYLFF